MTLQFPYAAVPLLGSVPPTLPVNSSAHWRPLIPIRVINPNTGSWYDLIDALIDSGADECALPIHVVQRAGLTLIPERVPRTRWRGTWWPQRFADVLLEIKDGTTRCTWPARIGLSNAPFTYPILGRAHFLQFFNVTLRGADQIVELEPNANYPGTIT
jgi:hypothetical protein